MPRNADGQFTPASAMGPMDRDPLPSPPHNPYLPAEPSDKERQERARRLPPDMEEALERHRVKQVREATRPYRNPAEQALDDRRAELADAWAKGEMSLGAYEAANDALEREHKAEQERVAEAARTAPQPTDTSPFFDISDEAWNFIGPALAAGIPVPIDLDPKEGRFHNLSDYELLGVQPHPRFVRVNPGDEDDLRFRERWKWRNSGSKRLSDDELGPLPEPEHDRCPKHGAPLFVTDWRGRPATATCRQDMGDRIVEHVLSGRVEHDRWGRRIFRVPKPAEQQPRLRALDTMSEEERARAGIHVIGG